MNQNRFMYKTIHTALSHSSNPIIALLLQFVWIKTSHIVWTIQTVLIKDPILIVFVFCVLSVRWYSVECKVKCVWNSYYSSNMHVRIWSMWNTHPCTHISTLFGHNIRRHIFKMTTTETNTDGNLNIGSALL